MFAKLTNYFRVRLQDLLRKQEGATMVEYALMVALIAVVCLLAVQYMGTQIFHVFDQVNTQLSTVPVTPGTPTTGAATTGS